MVGLKQPTSVAEAQKYKGASVYKLFDVDNTEYWGKVVAIDSEIVDDDGVKLKGIWFRIRYEDGDAEHIDWKEFHKWHANAMQQQQQQQQPTKGKGQGRGAAASQGGPADVAAVTDRNKRQCRMQQHTDAAEEEYEQPAAASGGQSAGNKRRRGGQAQEEAPPSAPVTASQRKQPRKSAAQQQQQQPRGRAAAAGGAAPDSAGVEQEEDVFHDAEEEQADGSDDYAPEQQRKQQQQRSNKKARNSGQQQPKRRRQAAESDVDEPDEDMQDADGGAADEEDAELDEEEVREAERQQAAWEAQQARQPRHLVVRRQGAAGHLKHVQVVNFMCHHNFIMDFGTHVNVISGRNGSGKSAVLQAMQAALGSKAKETGRGDNFRELIRTGCHEARVKVTLWNTGDDAYRHEVYGDWLTIERVIKSAGGTQYKLLNSQGKKVAEGYKQVAQLLDHLNVDASNPLAVLTQDTARNFLCGSVADKKKYEIFMKATCLQTMYDNLMKASGLIDEMKVGFKAVKEEHDARKAKADDLQTKLQKLQESGSKVEQRAMYESAVCWAAVKLQQEQADKIKAVLETKAPILKANTEAELARAEAELEECRRKEEELINAQNAEQEETRTFTEAMTELANQVKAAKTQTRYKQQAVRKLETQLQRVKAEMKVTLETKRESNDDRQREYQERLQQHEAKMAQARQKVEAAEVHLGQVQQHKERLRVDIDAKEKEVTQLRNRMQAEAHQAQNLKEHVEQAMAAKGNRIQMFGAHATLRQLVDRNLRQFKKPPIGPLGAHLSLTDGKWATASEVVLGYALEFWLVDNDADNKALRKLAGQVRGLNLRTVLVTRFDRQHYNIPDSKRLQQGWRNLREFIRIEHPDAQAQVIIDNKLMDDTKFESVVVHEEQEKCRDAIYRGDAGQAVNKAVHTSGLSFTRGRNNTITMANWPSHRMPRISTSNEDGLAQAQHFLQECEGRLAELQQQLSAADRELQQLRNQMRTLEQQDKKAVGDRARAGHGVQQLQMAAPVLELDEEDGEDAVAEELRRLQEAANDLQLRFDKADMELKEAQLNEDRAKKLHEDRQTEMQQTLSQMNDRTEELDCVAEQKEAAVKAKQQAEDKLEGYKLQVQKLQENLAKAVETLEQTKQAALMACTEEQGWAALEQATAGLRAEMEGRLRPRLEQQRRMGKLHFANDAEFEAYFAEHLQGAYEKVVDEKSGGSPYFQKKAAALEREIASAEQEAGGNAEELELNFKRAQHEYECNDAPVRNMSTVVKVCVKAVTERWQKYDELFADVSRTVSAKFQNYMHRRGHAGRVDVNQETGELKLLVKINAKSQGAEAKKSKAVKDLKQLSGGERSFTTVAFILALGKFTESPFRAMDEYDVFMDAVNRRIATQTLLEFALEENNLQFVLLTPQDLQAVEDAKQHLAASKGGQVLPEGFVKVVQMRPAREGGVQHH